MTTPQSAQSESVTQSPQHPSVKPPSKSRLLLRYFFPLKRLPEQTGCSAFLIEMLASNSEAAQKIKAIDKYREEFSHLFVEWGLRDLVEKENPVTTNWAAWQPLRQREITELPADNQVDGWLQEDLRNILERGLLKLGLDKQDLIESAEWSDVLDTKAQNPMMIYGPLLTTKTTIPEKENVYTIGKDGGLRFACYEVMLVALTQSRIATYTCHYNFMRNSIVQESAKEFLYRDVVSVSTEEAMSNYTFPSGKSLSVRRQFKLAVASGDNIIVSIASPEIREKLGAAPLLSDHDESVRAIREMLRSKKDMPAQIPEKPIAQKKGKANESDPVAKLAKLKQMLDAELITQEEYHDKKKEILSGL